MAPPRDSGETPSIGDLLAQAEAANERHDFVDGRRLADLLLDRADLDLASRAGALLQKGVAELHLGAYDASSRACWTGWVLARQHGLDPLVSAQLRAQLGVVCKQQGRHDDALEHALGALEEVEGRSEIAARELAATLHNNIAVILLGQRDPDSSIAHFERGLALLERLPEASGARAARVIQHINLGRVLLRLDRDTEAATHLLAGFELAVATGHDAARVRALEGLADANRKQGRLDEALARIDEVVAHWEAASDPLMRAGAYNTRGSILLERGDPGAVTDFQRALELADQTGHADLRLLARQNLVQVCEAEKRFEEACRWHHEIQALKEERFDALRSQQVEELKVRHALQAARDAAEAASRAKSSFLAVTSHELRTPLNAIVGYAELLLEELEIDGALTADAGEDDLHRILGSARRLLTLIDRILTLASLESGQERLAIAVFTPSVVFRQVVQAATSAAASRGNTLRSDLALEGEMCSDPQQLALVLQHLLENAVAFTEGGEIEVRAERRGNDLWFQVADQGIGIAPDQVAKLFQPFSQVDMSYTREREGLGLGLTLCAHHCRLLGGSIEARPQDPRGTVFEVRVPWQLELG
ncbi:MAG: tetratricopeptide repeat-containing sensor histidine kinase [Myxococcota bacterium]